ncbi:MAG TPA: methylated-DNA--[protein]-cysteine S-methyltransferase [Gemmataceae bacterium]
MYFTHLDSPLGPVLVAGDGAGLRFVSFQRSEAATRPAPDWVEAPEKFREACRQLRAYFAGELTAFDLPLSPQGTPFQRQVWRALCEIPYGEAVSYAEVARRIGRPTAARAVGSANRSNPLAVVVPCHRVIGSSGDLVGYAGGLEVKRFLLRLERAKAVA